LKYTITLRNSSNEDISADVKDAIPDELKYLSNSANKGGDYDSGTRTVCWSDVNVPADGETVLTFQVTAGSVDKKTVVMNIAEVIPDGNTDDAFHLGVTVWVLPGGNGEPPPNETDDLIVRSVEIRPRDSSGEADILTNRDVTVHIDAVDKNDTTDSITKMLVREWQVDPKPWPHWELVQETGWIDFDRNFPLRLGNQDGVHFVSVRVKDNEDCMSRLTRQGFDFASLVRDGAEIPAYGLVPYLAYYPKGTQVTATIDVTEGKAGLFVWKPLNFGEPDHHGDLSFSKTEIKFETATDGVYIFLVFSKEGATYDLEITPAGGRSASADISLAPTPASIQPAGSQASYFMSEPIFRITGLYPAGVDTIPLQPFDVTPALFLPLVSH
jgi:uncharacterized repeat protein (TIGR01451 family)